MALWDLQQTLTEATSDVHSFTFSNGHGWAASADYADEAIPYSTPDWTSEAPLTAASTYLTDIDISPDGQWLAYGTNAATAYVHSVGGTWPLEISLTDPGSGRTHVGFSRDSNWLAVASSDGNAYIYDPNSGFSLETTLDEGTDARYGITWNEDTSRLAVGGDGSTFRTYTVGGDWSVNRTETISWAIVRGMCYSRDTDSQYLAAGTNGTNCLVYDTSDFSTVATLTDLTGNATGVDISYGNNWLAVGSEDSNTYIYDMTNDFALETTLTDAGGNVGYYAGGVAFSPDGWLGYGSWDDAVYVHEAPVTTSTATVSGTFTYNGTGAEGAAVRGINDTQGTHQGIETTDANGDFSMEFPPGDEGHFMIEYQDPDTGELVKTPSKPFIVPE